MAVAANPVQVTASDRLGFSIFFAVVLHAIVILGIGFGFDFKQLGKTASMLEVTMVLTKTHQAPKDAKHIASENQLASGSTDKENQPTAPFTGNSLLPAQGVAPQQAKASIESKAEQKASPDKILTQQTSTTSINLQESLEKMNKVEEKKKQKLTQQEMELARLVAELNQEQQNYAKRPRVNYIDTLSAKTAVEASYVREWVDKVESVGNLNYPDEARKNRLSGTLILSVLLNNKGQIVNMEIQSSAGKSILDEAAKRIVKIASPFKVFPEEMKNNYDQLMITRTWLFGKDNRLLTK